MHNSRHKTEEEEASDMKICDQAKHLRNCDASIVGSISNTNQRMDVNTDTVTQNRIRCNLSVMTSACKVQGTDMARTIYYITVP